MTQKSSKPIVVVSNTSPIYYAIQLGKVDLLRELYGGIFIPEQVAHELVGGVSGRMISTQLKVREWIQTKSVANQSYVARLNNEIDLGEAEAIALAKELYSDLLLIDDQLGRKIADREGVRKTGILGVLLDAKRTNLIPQIKPLLNKLYQETNFHGSNELYQQALALAGE